MTVDPVLTEPVDLVRTDLNWFINLLFQKRATAMHSTVYFIDVRNGRFGFSSAFYKLKCQFPLQATVYLTKRRNE
jgi:hypothetical protein